MQNKITYHLSCPHCFKLWWSENPFPQNCPYCKEKITINEVSKNDK